MRRKYLTVHAQILNDVIGRDWHKTYTARAGWSFQGSPDGKTWVQPERLKDVAGYRFIRAKNNLTKLTLTIGE